MAYFLGIDVGSSKTHALIADATGRCIGFGSAGGGNHQGGGYAALEQALMESFRAAQAMAGIEPAHIGGAGFGVAGYDFPSDREQHLATIARLGLTCPLGLVNDGFNGLFAGAAGGIGVNVTAGSSNNCRGRNRHGQEGRIVGNGAAFGEYGGAHEIVQRGLQMVNYAWIRRIAPTALTAIYLGATGARDECDLMEGLSNGRYTLDSGLAPAVIRAAQAGDPAGVEVAVWAGAELGWLAVAVARQIGLEAEAVDVVQSGSVFDAGEIITAPMRAVVTAHCPRANLIRLQGPPVIGAVVLGMEQAGVDGYAVRAELTHTVQEAVR